MFSQGVGFAMVQHPDRSNDRGQVSAGRTRLQSIIRDRKAAQRYIWRARIILLAADGIGTTGGHPRCQQGQNRGLAPALALDARRGRGPPPDKTRPLRIPLLLAATVDRAVAETIQTPPHRDALDRTGHGQNSGDQPVRGVSHLEKGTGCSRIVCAGSSSLTIPNSPRNSRRSSVSFRPASSRSVAQYR
jgi:hypothetical protein